MTVHTRFAPSPTGPLHLGHAYSALLAFDFARAQGGKFTVRIEDLDQSRARDHWEDQIYDDLAWLGLEWTLPIMRQSDRTAAYDDALDQLWDRGMVYPCCCSRRDIKQAANAPQEGAQFGPDGIIYPGTCRKKTKATTRPRQTTLRFNMSQIAPDATFSYVETGPSGHTSKTIQFTGQDCINTIGDVVVARRDLAAAYHLAVVIDDNAQGITHAVRGSDLAEATKIHLVLQNALGIKPPQYLHHDLIRDDAGKRLAKRDDAKSIASLRAQGATPAGIRNMVGL